MVLVLALQQTSSWGKRGEGVSNSLVTLTWVTTGRASSGVTAGPRVPPWG